jgi:G:T-mismatch repair DNA endonuclease (very short patch repair protein)
MDEQTRKKIIEEYLNGKGSTLISKEINLSKPTILKVLNEEKLIRKRDRCNQLKILKDDKGYYIDRECSICHNIIKTYSKDKTIACRNHFNKIKNNSLCKPCSLKLQVGEGNPFYGKKHTKETKQKISKKREGKAVGDKNSMSNPIWRNKASENLKKRWDSGELEETRKKMSEHMKKTRRKGKLKSVITSKKEKEIINFLKKKNLSPIHSFRVDTKICDIFIPEFNLIIEYFGDYWHCNPKKYEETYYHKNKSMTAKEIWEYDSKKVDLIKSYGYNLEVIWESDLKNDNKLINKIIEKYVKSK